MSLINPVEEDLVMQASVKGLEDPSCADSIKEDVILAKIGKLEVEAEHRKERLEEKLQKMDDFEKKLLDAKLHITQIESSVTTFKYVVGVFIALTGGIITFVVTELIKII